MSTYQKLHRRASIINTGMHDRRRQCNGREHHVCVGARTEVSETRRSLDLFAHCRLVDELHPTPTERGTPAHSKSEDLAADCPFTFR